MFAEKRPAGDEVGLAVLLLFVVFSDIMNQII